MNPDLDTDRADVRTYVPTYQKNIWKQEAEARDMSLSEFVRCMVQAGRQGFEGTRLKGDPGDVTPGGESLETYLLDVLDDEPQPFETIVDQLRADVKDTMQTMRNEGAIEQSIEGGWRTR